MIVTIHGERYGVRTFVTQRRLAEAKGVRIQLGTAESPQNALAESSRSFHPGIVLRDWMRDDISLAHLAKHLGVSRISLRDFLNGRTGMTIPLALKLADSFPSTEARLWMDLQVQYDLGQALQEERTPLPPIRVKAVQARKKVVIGGSDAKIRAWTEKKLARAKRVGQLRTEVPQPQGDIC